jgi:hypothetical protein
MFQNETPKMKRRFKMRRQALPTIMLATLHDANHAVLDLIDKPVLVVNSSGPVA